MKRNVLVSILALLALFAVPAWGKPKSLPKPSDKELADITSRGILLAEYDQAVWHATDAVQATHPPEGRVTRYIARKTATGWVVDFGRLDAGNDKFLVANEAVQTDDPSHFAVSALEPERQDTNLNLAEANAIDHALADFGGVSLPYNVALLPADSGELFVYLYPAQVKDGVYPYGGDVRYLMSADGKTIIVKRQLHKAVLESTPANLPSDSTVAAGYHMHVLTDLPEDTDVFLVLSRRPRVPEYVGAGGHVFEIAIDGKIKIVK